MSRRHTSRGVDPRESHSQARYPSCGPRILLVALLAAYLGLAIAYSIYTPLGQGPDEPAHFIYIREIAEHFRIPTLAHEVVMDASLRSSHEAHQPPLYYALSAPAYLAGKALGDGDTGWRAIRFFTSLLGVLWVLLLYRLCAQVLRPQGYAPILAAAVVGLLPLSTYLGGVVNNTMMINVTFTASMIYLVHAVRTRDFDTRRALIVGLLSGLTALSKPQGYFLFVMIGVACLLILRHTGWRAYRRILGSGALAVITGAIVVVPWLVRNYIAVGTPVPISLYHRGFEPSLVSLYLISDQLFKYFWTPFWLVKSFVHPLVYSRVLMACCFLVVAGSIVHLARLSRNGETEEAPADVWALLALPLLMIYLFLTYLVLYVDSGLLQEAHLLLPAAGILGIAVLAGLGSFFRGRIVRPVLGALLAASLLAANVRVLYLVYQFYQHNF